jgi:hypothetical protein
VSGCSFAHGLSTALVVDLGATSVEITPVESGYPVMMGFKRSVVAGDFLDQTLEGCMRHITTPPVAIPPTPRVESFGRLSHAGVRRVRERLVDAREIPLTEAGTFDFRARLLTPSDEKVRVGSTESVVSGSWRGVLGDVLFSSDLLAPLAVVADAATAGRPGAFGSIPPDHLPTYPLGHQPLHDLVAGSLVSCDEGTRAGVGDAVLLTGGLSCTPHLADRLNWELERLDIMATGIHAHLLPVPAAETSTSPWIGGSILASAGTLPDLFVTVDEWRRDPAVLHVRCP